MKKMLKEIHSLCREIDLLAPAHFGRDKDNPVNCEYPWEMTDIEGVNFRAFASCEYSFAIFNKKHQPFIKKNLILIEE